MRNKLLNLASSFLAVTSAFGVAGILVASVGSYVYLVYNAFALVTGWLPLGLGDLAHLLNLILTLLFTMAFIQTFGEEIYLIMEKAHDWYEEFFEEWFY